MSNFTRKIARRQNGPKAIAGVHLVKVLDDPEADKEADEIMDLWQVVERGANTSFQTADEKESEARYQRQFFTVMTRKLKERCPWVAGQAHASTDDKGYQFLLRDREGREYYIPVPYEYLADIAEKHGLDGDLRPLADGVIDQLLAKRDEYFSRMV